MGVVNMVFVASQGCLGTEASLKKEERWKDTGNVCICIDPVK